MKQDLKGLNLLETENLIKTIGEKSYRAKQIFPWIYLKGVAGFKEITNIGKALQEKLEQSCVISSIKTIDKITSAAKDTEKYLFQLKDGETTESVLMRYDKDLGPGRVTLCISTQVGCSMKCKFCASGLDGLKRNLTAGEIVDQVIQIQKDIIKNEERAANIVFMGIGEPLANYDNVLKAVRLINSPDGIAIGIRHIAISTCGLGNQIKRLAKENLQLRLAVSLHATTNEIRNLIMPINKKFPIEELIDACRYYQEIAGRRITFEYALIDGLNDTIRDADRLAYLLKDIDCIINLIPLNQIPEFSYKRSTNKKAQEFKRCLEDQNMKVTFRRERGLDINAACGQLRREAACAYLQSLKKR